jgi:hypothetical protein
MDRLFVGPDVPDEVEAVGGPPEWMSQGFFAGIHPVLRDPLLWVLIPFVLPVVLTYGREELAPVQFGLDTMPLPFDPARRHGRHARTVGELIDAGGSDGFVLSKIGRGPWLTLLCQRWLEEDGRLARIRISLGPDAAPELISGLTRMDASLVKRYVDELRAALSTIPDLHAGFEIDPSMPERLLGHAGAAAYAEEVPAGEREKWYRLLVIGDATIVREVLRAHRR